MFGDEGIPAARDGDALPILLLNEKERPRKAGTTVTIDKGRISYRHMEGKKQKPCLRKPSAAGESERCERFRVFEAELL